MASSLSILRSAIYLFVAVASLAPGTAAVAAPQPLPAPRWFYADQIAHLPEQTVTAQVAKPWMGDYTLLVWVRATENIDSYSAVFSSLSNPGAGGTKGTFQLDVFEQNGIPYYRWYSEQQVGKPNYLVAPVETRWQFIALVREGTSLKVFCDNKLQAEYQVDFFEGKLFKHYVVGQNRGGTKLFSGEVSKLRIYDQVLSEEEVSYIYGRDQLEDDRYESEHQIARVTPREDRETILKNPGMGWVFYQDAAGHKIYSGDQFFGKKYINYKGFEKSDGFELDQIAHHGDMVLFRIPWAKLEPKKGKYAWAWNGPDPELGLTQNLFASGFLDFLAQMKKHGLRLSLEILLDAKGNYYGQATPGFVVSVNEGSSCIDEIVNKCDPEWVVEQIKIDKDGKEIEREEPKVLDNRWYFANCELLCPMSRSVLKIKEDGKQIGETVKMLDISSECELDNYYCNCNSRSGAKETDGLNKRYECYPSPYRNNAGFRKHFKEFVEALANEFDDPDFVDVIGVTDGWWDDNHHVHHLNPPAKRANPGAPDRKEDRSEYFKWLHGLFETNFKQVLLSHTSVVPANYNQETGYTGWSEADQRRAVALGKLIKETGVGRFINDYRSSWLNSFWPHTPVIGERGFWGGDFGDNGKLTLRERLEKAVNEALEHHANYLDLRIPTEALTLVQAHPDLVRKFALKGGYRLVLRNFEFNQFNNSNVFRLKHSWKNVGAGKLPNNLRGWEHKYRVAFGIFSNDNLELKQLIIDDAMASNWIQKPVQQDGTPLAVCSGNNRGVLTSAAVKRGCLGGVYDCQEGACVYDYETIANVGSLPSGEYYVGVSLVDVSKDAKPAISLALSQTRTDDGWYILAGAPIKIVDSERVNSVTMPPKSPLCQPYGIVPEKSGLLAGVAEQQKIGLTAVKRVAKLDSGLAANFKRKRSNKLIKLYTNMNSLIEQLPNQIMVCENGSGSRKLADSQAAAGVINITTDLRNGVESIRKITARMLRRLKRLGLTRVRKRLNRRQREALTRNIEFIVALEQKATL